MGNIDTTQRACTSAKRLLGAGVVMMLLLAGASCSGSDSKSSSRTIVPAVAPPLVQTAATAPAATAAASATLDTTAGSTATAETAVSADAVALTGATPSVVGANSAADVGLTSANPFGTALAITAAVSVRVDDVRAAVNRLPDLVAANGGAIFDSQVSVGDPAKAAAAVTVKIPPAGLEALIRGLGGLGELTARTQQTEDVADQLADTQNRIAAAQASVDRVRTLLATATDLDAIIRIEGELTIRETSLEQLLATERNVTDRVQLATLTITLTPTPPAPLVVAEAKPKLVDTGSDVKPSNSVGRALGAGWNGFVRVVHAIAIGVAFMLPVITLVLLGGLMWLVLHRVRRGRRGRHVHQPAPAE